MKSKYPLVLLNVMAISYSISIDAQNISFAYDNAGNRIKREIVVNTKRVPGQSARGESFVEEMLLDKKIRIYPNPTSGMLKIEIQNFETDNYGTMSLYSTSGIMMLSLEINSPVTEIDISTYAGGIYILQIDINGQETSWKIIKE